MSDDDCIADFKLRCRQRTTYPGASAFDFSAILNIVISDILGWDEENGCSTEEGGAFGKIDAFSGAIEEQGRKTLHVHICSCISKISPSCLKDYKRCIPELTNVVTRNLNVH